MPAKNLLMFSIDDMRAVENWGHFTPLVSTPNLDRLAELGTTFTRAVTQVPLCNPSRTSVFTGLQPSETGVLENNVPWFDRVDAAQTLPAVLKAAGVYVAMYGKHFHNHDIGARDQALMFDEYLPGIAQGVPGQVINDGVRHDLPLKSGRYGGSPEALQDEITADAAIDFLQNTAGDLSQPFFLGVGIFKPHLNWWVPPRFFDRYDPAEIRAALRQSLSDGTIIPGNGEYFDVPPMTRPTVEHEQIGANLDLWADYIHGYLAAISYADSKVGAVLNALEADPALAADTAILLWSDHGFHLGDKDRWLKFSHWREATQVPFVLVDPDTPGGQTANQVVSLVDIFPTVLDMMGVDRPQGLRLSGNSLRPIVEDIDIGWYNPAAGKGVALTTIYGSVSIRARVPGEGDLRYTRYPDGTEELYHLGNDPNEHVNRVNFETGGGLTPADDRRHAIMSGLMDEQLEMAGILVSDGSGAVVGSAARELLVSTNGPGENLLSGGGGGDTYVLYRNATVTEAAGGGFDCIVIRNPELETRFALPANIEMVQVMKSFTGDDRPNHILSGFEATSEGLPGGHSGVLRGAGGNDTITGDHGNDTMDGGAGADSLVGETGRDVLTGGAGSDVLTGGIGNDVFRFNAASDSTPTASDTITAFAGPGRAAGDRIDLSAIDANVQIAGNQSFAFGGTATGHVRVVASGSSSVVLANTDADAAPEVRIVIKDGGTLPGAYTDDDIIL